MSPSYLLGTADKHYVMSQLLRCGSIDALAPVDVTAADIVITGDAGERTCALQLKTRREIGSDGCWHTKARHEGIRSASLSYVFLSLPNNLHRLPDAFVIPSDVVGDALYQTQRAWLARPGRGGVPHKDGDIRRFLPGHSREGLEQEFGPGWLEQYRDARHFLGPENS